MKLVAVVFALLTLWAADALACSCGQTIISSPPNGSELVPLNVVLQLRANTPFGETPKATLKVLNTEERVDLIIDRRSSTWLTIRPTNPLRPRTGFELALEVELGARSATVFFATGSERDDTPPDAVAFKGTSRTTSAGMSSCGGTSETIDLTLGTAPVDVALIVSSGVDTEHLDDVFGSTVFFTGELPRLSDANCTKTFGPTEDLVDLAFGVKTIDWAGNESTVIARQVKEGGCSAAPAGLSWLALTALLLREKKKGAR